MKPDGIIQKRDNSIDLIRVTAMLFIIVCHIFNEYPATQFLGQAFNVGVDMFLFLSGYLYGMKEITNSWEWIKRRCFKILVPMYGFMVVLFSLNFVFSQWFDIKYFFYYALDIQGFTGGIRGGEHLWYLTVIMICYLLTPALYRVKRELVNVAAHKGLALFGLLAVVQAVLAFQCGKRASEYFLYVELYAFAYLYGERFKGRVPAKRMCIVSFIAFFSVLVRFASRLCLDGSILYERIIVLYTQAVLGIWLFCVIGACAKFITKGYVGKLVSRLGPLTFELYLVHYMYIVGPVCVMHVTGVPLVNVGLVLVLAYLTAEGLRWMPRLFAVAKKIVVIGNGQ